MIYSFIDNKNIQMIKNRLAHEIEDKFLLNKLIQSELKAYQDFKKINSGTINLYNDIYIDDTIGVVIIGEINTPEGVYKIGLYQDCYNNQIRTTYKKLT